MVLQKKKKEKIRKYLKDGKTWEYIRNKTGVSNDAINNIRRESPSSPTSTAPQADKTPKVLQDQTKQIIDKVSTTNEDKQHPTTNNTPDPNYQRLEQMIKDSDHARQTQKQTTDLQIQNVTKIVNQLTQSKQKQETTEPHQEKPDDQPNLNELKNQEFQTKSLPSTIPEVQQPKMNQDKADVTPPETQIQIHPPSSLDSNVGQTSEVDLDQTDEPPQEKKREYVEIHPFYLEFAYNLIMLPAAIDKAKETGVFNWPLTKNMKKTQKKKMQ
jgi:hypothetical protein